MGLFSRHKVILGLLAIFVFSAVTLEAADPVVVEVHFQNGVKFYKRGLYDRAAAEFEKTLSLEPAHEEAKIYLEKTRLIQKNQTKVEAKASQNTEIKQLYADGSRLYKERKYEEAIDVFNKILQIKPIDDFASYYKEKSEIMISRKLKREKKIEDKQKLKAARAQAKMDRRAEKEARALKRKEAKEAARRPVDKDDRTSVVTQDLAAYEVETASEANIEAETEKPLDKKARLRQERLAEKEEKRRAKRQAIEEKKKEKQDRLAAKKSVAEERRQAKIDAKYRAKKEKEERLAARKEADAERRQAKKDAAVEKRIKKKETTAERRQEAAAEKQSARVDKALKKESAKEAAQTRKENKALFVKGVQQYGRKQYGDAIATFEELILIESRTGDVYSGTARRLIQKAELRLKGEGQDLAIEKK